MEFPDHYKNKLKMPGIPHPERLLGVPRSLQKTSLQCQECHIRRGYLEFPDHYKNKLKMPGMPHLESVFEVPGSLQKISLSNETNKKQKAKNINQRQRPLDGQQAMLCNRPSILETVGNAELRKRRMLQLKMTDTIEVSPR